MRKLALLTCVLSSFVGCDYLRKPKVDPQAFCAQLKDAATTKWATCRGISPETAALLFEREFHCQRWLRLAALKRVEADQALADKCLAAARDSCVTLDAALTPEGACGMTFTPNSRAGDDCISQQECFDQRCVVNHDTDCTGVCVTPRAVGQPCLTSDDCTRSAYCASSGKCAAYPDPGQTCFNSQCAPGSACDGSRCRALPLENLPCLNGACAIPLLCLTVGDVQQCVSSYAVADGMKCSGDCGTIARCVGATPTEKGTCQVLAALDAACTDDLPCRNGLRCSDGRCVATATVSGHVGESCSRDPPACEASVCDPNSSTCAHQGLGSGCFIH